MHGEKESNNGDEPLVYAGSSVTAKRKQRVTVYVADDHPIYRQGLVEAIKARPDLEFVGEADERAHCARGDPQAPAARSR